MAEKSDGVALDGEGTRRQTGGRETRRVTLPGEEVSVGRTGPVGRGEADDEVGRTA